MANAGKSGNAGGGKSASGGKSALDGKSASGEKSAGGEWAEHLEELRRRIIAALVVFTAAASVSFAFSGDIAAFLTGPVSDLGVKLYTFNPAEKFMAYVHLSVWTGALVCAPFCLLQVGLFVWPALRGRERVFTPAALIAVPALFIAGAAAAYYFLSPVALRFFLRFAAADEIQPLWGFREYLGLLYALMLAFGLLLQTPLLLLFVFATGIVTPRQVARARPYIIFLIFLAAAICTPPDVISQVALGAPLYLLFELTLIAGRFFQPDKKRMSRRNHSE
ncbi:MAG: twin-arginine translocase subunit TatC [Treponema sp.]|jgi:sec-independent protein translocase protein TatC|nr:twin-arginine translocase subunit TatC [Treponema sp.]